MADLTLWHNPRCSKSRAAKAILDDSAAAYVERRYLDEPPSADELGALCTALGKDPWEIARMGEDAAKTLNLAELPHEQGLWLEAMSAHPILIERPILVTADGRALVGRPPEAIEALLPDQARPPYDPKA
jgi:arsenate reductase (glutaredoxin)